MKNICLAGVSVMLAFFGCASAHGDTFQFSFVGSQGYSGAGQFTASETSSGRYLVTAVAGAVTTSNGSTTNITGLAAAGSTYQLNDNLLFYPGVNGPDFFDGSGVAFNLANSLAVGLYAYSGVNLYNTGAHDMFGDPITAFPDNGPISVTAATPEPNSLLLLGTGAMTLLLTMRRRVLS